MPAHHPQAELAPRDVVSRAIVAEVRRSGFPHVWLDATHLGAAFLRERFPAIFQTLARFGIDPSREWIPVHPSAHYHCGGVLADAQGRSGVPGLLVCGEVACTGLHGANRLASNSLLEAVVMGQRAGRQASAAGGFPGRVRLAAPRRESAPEGLDTADLVQSIRALTWRSLGIERDAAGIQQARRSFQFWNSHQASGAFATPAGWEMQNQLLVASLVAVAADARRASVGTHLRSDSQGPIETRHYAWRRPESQP
jgi:L-aspartate oxidase